MSNKTKKKAFMSVVINNLFYCDSSFINHSNLNTNAVRFYIFFPIPTVTIIFLLRFTSKSDKNLPRILGKKEQTLITCYLNFGAKQNFDRGSVMRNNFVC
jgi:hypothetical protein